MRICAGLLLLLLLAAALVPHTAAAGITITADRPEFSVPLGTAADIPLSASSTFSHPVDGTLRITTTEELQNAGNVMISTKNRVFNRTVPAGESPFPVSTGESEVPRTVRMQVAFQYSDGSPVLVTLPEILVHFGGNTSAGAGNATPVISTSGPGSPGGLGESSVRIAQQAVSVQQQAERDGIPQISRGTQSLLQTNASAGQLVPGAAMSPGDLQDFLRSVGADPLVQSVRGSLSAQGFVCQSVAAKPVSGTEGTFSQEYRDPAGGAAVVRGAMANGTVLSVIVQSDAPIAIPPALETNASYLSFTGSLAAGGYRLNGTAMNLTLAGADVNLTFTGPGGMPAFLLATVVEGNVTRVTLARENPFPGYLVAGTVLAAILLVTGGLIFVKRKNARLVPAETGDATGTWPDDHRDKALEIIAGAEAAFTEGRPATAYGLAGRALRLFLSREYGDGREATAEEIAALIAGKRTDAAAIAVLLDMCSDVAFARGVPDPDRFREIIGGIRDIVVGT